MTHHHLMRFYRLLSTYDKTHARKELRRIIELLRSEEQDWRPI
jgi:hypothetical protein